MNKQGPDGISWTEQTWNPVTGCNHGCSYCYARRIAERFKSKAVNCHDCTQPGNGLHEVRYKGYDGAFRYGFDPTLHSYRLDEPKNLKTPSKIFVSSMGDLFGSWVPDEWINAVLDTVRACPQHTFQFLTKNPYRYREFEFPGNCWLGTSADNFVDLAFEQQNLLRYAKRAPVKFLSLEPLLSQMAPEIFYQDIDWIIIGQQTGPGAEPVPDEWVENIIEEAKRYNLPVFVKRPLYERFPVQQWPEVSS
jgi:protein gp37